ncbi:TPA: hypothetical protein LS257_001873 [Serratia liquefaciens]|nr:hypothetical protein [Serratia liquefaciens]
MAKRKSNRAARRLLYVPIAGYGDCFRISNRRWQVYSSNYPHVWQVVKPTRKQRIASLKELAEWELDCEKWAKAQEKAL